MMKTTDNYYLEQDEPNRSCLLALREFVLKYDPGISEALKWGIPSFSLDKKMCLFFNIDKKTKQPYLLFSNGNEMEHPLLEQGTRLRMKTLVIDPNMDLPIKVLNDLMCQAVTIGRTKNSHWVKKRN